MSAAFHAISRHRRGTYCRRLVYVVDRSTNKSLIINGAAAAAAAAIPAASLPWPVPMMKCKQPRVPSGRGRCQCCWATPRLLSKWEQDDYYLLPPPAFVYAIVVVVVVVVLSRPHCRKLPIRIRSSGSQCNVYLATDSNASQWTSPARWIQKLEWRPMDGQVRTNRMRMMMMMVVVVSSPVVEMDKLVL